MPFISKIKITELTKNKVINYTCKQCKKLNTTTLNIFTKHLVIYWVLPLFSFGKKANTICSHCNLVIKKKHFNEELTLSFQNNKVNAKIPFWHSTGLILFILLFLPVVISLVSIMINELMNK